MTDPAREDERRELERRAFGRDGSGLSAAEAARLSELRRSALPSPVPEEPGASPVPERAASSVPEYAAVAPRLERERQDAELPSAVPPAPAPEQDGGRPILSRFRARFATFRWTRPRVIVGTAAALLLVGLLIGWGIPRAPVGGLALRDGEDARRDAVLAANDEFDAGSLLLLARQGDALLWTATSARGEVRCLIIDVAPPPAPRPMESDCRPANALQSQPLQAISAPTNVSADSSRALVTYAGYVLISANGVPIGALQRMEYFTQSDRGLTDAEGLAAERIRREQGFAHVALAARWRGLIVWMGYTTQNEQCLVVEDPALRSSCADPTAAPLGLDRQSGDDEPMLSLDLRASGDRPRARIEMWNPVSSAGYIVITEQVPGLFPERAPSPPAPGETGG